MSMHALQVIEETGSKPMEKAQTATVQAHHVAHTIFAQFATEGQESQTRVELVRSWAIGDERLTWDQLTSELNAAIVMASEADTRNGWTAPEGAKGAAKYGPRRATLNTKTSEIRTLWGALVHCNAGAEVTSDGEACKPVIPHGMGFAQAVVQARNTLKAHGVKPDGSRVLSDVEKAGITAAQVDADAKMAFIKANPQQAGETLETYSARIEAGMGKERYKILMEGQKAVVAKVCDKLVKDYGFDDCLEIVIELRRRVDAYLDGKGVTQSE